MIAIQSTPDVVQFYQTLKRKLVEVTLEYERAGGEPLHKRRTRDVTRAMAHLSNMQQRWAKGDYTHTLDEQRSLKVVGDWLIEQFHSLRGTNPPTSLDYARD